MWNKFSYRFKITFIFTVSLIVLTLSLTVLSTLNATQNISNPLTTTLFNFGDGMPINENPLYHRQHLMPINENILYHMHINKNPLYDRQHLMPINENILPHEVYFQQCEEFSNINPEIGLTIEESGLCIAYQLQRQLNVAGHNFRQRSFWIAGMVILIGSMVAYFMAGVIVRPIKKLSTSVEKIEADNLNVTLPIPKSHDEISQLTVSFNEMLNKLNRSFESKQLFAQNASHELKTPLAIIRSHIEALEMDDDPTIDDYEEVLVEVKTSTERMISLVEGLLAMGKSTAESDMTVFQGREIFESIIHDLKDAIHSKHLNVQILSDITIKGDKTLLSQAFFNLIHNAIRYNVEGGSIVVTMSESQITIEDTGTGIPSESIGQLFDPFYCVDKSRSKKLGGNGLGLAITKNIMDAHHMKIEVISEVGIGTVISIYL